MFPSFFAEFGTRPKALQNIAWFDESKAHLSDFRHRALRHHSEGIWMCEKLFGVVLINADGKAVPVRAVGEQHIKDDLGWIPTVKDWLQHLEVQPWMTQTRWKPSREAEKAPSETPSEPGS